MAHFTFFNRVSQHQNVSILDFILELRMMEVLVTTGAIRRSMLSNRHRHHQRTNIQLFMGRMPFLSPNQQCQSTDRKQIKMVSKH